MILLQTLGSCQKRGEKQGGCWEREGSSGLWSHFNLRDGRVWKGRRPQSWSLWFRWQRLPSRQQPVPTGRPGGQPEEPAGFFSAPISFLVSSGIEARFGMTWVRYIPTMLPGGTQCLIIFFVCELKSEFRGDSLTHPYEGPHQEGLGSPGTDPVYISCPNVIIIVLPKQMPLSG